MLIGDVSDAADDGQISVVTTEEHLAVCGLNNQQIVLNSHFKTLKLAHDIE